jgi:hypothetical protein
MARITLCAVLVGYLVCGTAAAQQIPNFGGVWVMDMSQSETAVQPGHPERPIIEVITQTPKSITIRRDVDGRADVLAYPFEGDSALKSAPIDRPEAGSAPRSSAAWNDGALQTIAYLTINGEAVNRFERRSLDANNTRMTVETTISVQHGYLGPSGKAATGVMKDVYIKQTPVP